MTHLSVAELQVRFDRAAEQLNEVAMMLSRGEVQEEAFYQAQAEHLQALRELETGKMRETVRHWTAHTLITYHASAVRRLAEDPTRSDREAIFTEQVVIADEMRRRMEAN